MTSSSILSTPPFWIKVAALATMSVTPFALQAHVAPAHAAIAASSLLCVASMVALWKFDDPITAVIIGLLAASITLHSSWAASPGSRP